MHARSCHIYWREGIIRMPWLLWGHRDSGLRNVRDFDRQQALYHCKCRIHH